MDAIHQLSSVTPLPEFDLWGVPPTQLTVEKTFSVDYRPLTTVDSHSPILFSFTSALDEYVKLDEIYLSWNVQVELIKNDKTALALADYSESAFAAYALHSMIKQVEISINNKSINNLPQNYSYRAFIEALLGFSKNARKSHLESAYWSETFKTSLSSSSDLKKSIVYNMMGKLHTDLGFQGRFLIGGCDLKIELTLNSPKFFLKLRNGLSATFSLSDVVLHVKKAKVSQNIVEAHQKAMKISPAKYPITRCEVKSVVLPKGVNDVVIDNFVHGQLPRRMFVFLVDNDNFSGSYSKDSFFFNVHDLNYICAFVDGVSFPSQPYQPDFENNIYMREYLGLFDALNQNNTDPLCNLEKNTYKGTKQIFGFNFSPDLSDGFGLEGHSSLLKKGALRIQLKFKTALPVTVNVLAYCEFDNIIEINHEGVVTTNINNV